MPTLIFIAGPNGSGKSTIASRPAFQRLFATPESDSPIRVNPDDILRGLLKAQADTPRRVLEGAAAVQADQMVSDAIDAGRSVLRETVLSTDRLMADVVRAKAAGYRFVLFVMLLRTPEDNVARVRQRVALGGHGVPEEKIRERWKRAMDILPQYAELADVLFIFDNTRIAEPTTPQAGPLLLVEVSPEGVYVADEARALAAGPASPLQAMLAQIVARFDP